jgi:hypothetical protein
LSFFLYGASGCALAVNVYPQVNRIRGRRDDHSNRNWILEIDTFIPDGVVLMLIVIGIAIGNRCSELGLGFGDSIWSQNEPCELKKEP